MTVRKQGWTLSQCVLTLWIMLGQTTHDMTSNIMTSASMTTPGLDMTLWTMSGHMT